MFGLDMKSFSTTVFLQGIIVGIFLGALVFGIGISIVVFK